MARAPEGEEESQDEDGSRPMKRRGLLPKTFGRRRKREQ